MWGDCTVDCAEAGGGCIACGACMVEPLEVTNGAPAEVAWPGHTYTFDHTASGCSCHVRTPAAAGKYRATIRVYASEEAVTSGELLRVVEHDFELPAPGGVVTVPLAE